MSVSQKQAVIEEVNNLLPNFVTDKPVKEQITSEQKKLIVDSITERIIKGDVQYSKPTTDRLEVRKYVVGMVDNHFRKAKELNGGTSKPTKKKSNDEILENLSVLKDCYDEDSREYNKIQEAIKQREMELSATKKTKGDKIVKMIGTSIVPNEIKELLEEQE